MGKNGKSRSIIVPFFILLVILTIAAALAFVLFSEMGKRKREPVYRTVSLSEEATARAYVWLNQIEEMPLSYEEVKQIMGTIHLTLVLTPTEEKGVYRRSLEEGSFEECEERAEQGLEEAYRKVAEYRFRAAGYEGELSEGMLDEVMQEAYGVSVAEYLKLCGLQLLPTLEELTEIYSGEVADE